MAVQLVWRSAPEKPRRMRWTVVARSAGELAGAEHDALAAWVADTDVLLARLDRKYGPPP
jgi:hypothetical protein